MAITLARRIPSPLLSLSLSSLLLLPLLASLASATTTLRGVSGVSGVSAAQHQQQVWEQRRELQAAPKLSFKPAAAASTGGSILTPPSQITPICDIAGPVNLTLTNNRLSPRVWKGWGTSLAW